MYQRNSRCSCQVIFSPECCSLPPTMGGSEAGPEVTLGGGATKLEAMGGGGWCARCLATSSSVSSPVSMNRFLSELGTRLGGPEAGDIRGSVLRMSGALPTWTFSGPGAAPPTLEGG